MPAASEAAGAPGGGGGDVEQQQYEIRNDEGFVYRVPAGLYHNAAPSTTQTDPRVAGLRRRRRALLRLRARRLRQVSRWDALASARRAPLPAPQPPASPPASPHPVADVASSSSASFLDDLLAQLDIQKEAMKQAQQLCDETNTLCDEMVDSFVPLSYWGRDSRELAKALFSPDGGTAAPDNSGETIEVLETSGVSSATAGMIKNSDDKRMGDDVTPPIRKTSRMLKRVSDLSNSCNVASKASIESKRKKASETRPPRQVAHAGNRTPGSSASAKQVVTWETKQKGPTSTTPCSPRSKIRRKADFLESPVSKIRRKPASPARTSDMFCSPGQLTSRKAAAENL